MDLKENNIKVILECKIYTKHIEHEATIANVKVKSHLGKINKKKEKLRCCQKSMMISKYDAIKQKKDYDMI